MNEEDYDSMGAYFKFYELVLGDADGDGELTAADALILRKYCARVILEDSLDTLAADMNLDGKTNAKDLLMIRKALAE